MRSISMLRGSRTAARRSFSAACSLSPLSASSSADVSNSEAVWERGPAGTVTGAYLGSAGAVEGGGFGAAVEPAAGEEADAAGAGDALSARRAVGALATTAAASMTHSG